MGGASSKQSKASSIVQPASSNVQPISSQSLNTAIYSSPTHSRPPTSVQTPLNISIDTVNQSILLSHGLNKNFSTEMLITPGREESMYSKVAYTPQGDQARTYKYYCPLCMSFCMDIFKSKCCNNYTCGECCTEFLAKRDQPIHTMNDLLANAPYKDTACPHCNTLHFHPTLVTKTDTVRDYSFNTVPAGPSLPMHSPLKIGDSFEVMKRKMEKLNATPGTITEGVESPMKTLFPDTARGTPRGIAMKPPAGGGGAGDVDSASPGGGVLGPGSGSGSSFMDTELHRALALSFVSDIFSSQEQQCKLEESSSGHINSNSNSVSEVATSFVNAIFNPRLGTSAGRRNSRISKVSPFDLSDGCDGVFDNVSIDGSNSHRDEERVVSSRQHLLQQSGGQPVLAAQ